MTGQLGNGTTTSTSSPGPVTGLTGVAFVSGGNWVAYAVLSDGRLTAWGTALDIKSAVPVSVTELPKMVSVTGAGGKFFSIAVFADGSAAIFQP